MHVPAATAPPAVVQPCADVVERWYSRIAARASYSVTVVTAANQVNRLILNTSNTMCVVHECTTCDGTVYSEVDTVTGNLMHVIHFFSGHHQQQKCVDTVGHWMKQALTPSSLQQWRDICTRSSWNRPSARRGMSS
jgi:hypothetical protein